MENTSPRTLPSSRQNMEPGFWNTPFIVTQSTDGVKFIQSEFSLSPVTCPPLAHTGQQMNQVLCPSMRRQPLLAQYLFRHPPISRNVQQARRPLSAQRVPPGGQAHQLSQTSTIHFAQSNPISLEHGISFPHLFLLSCKERPDALTTSYNVPGRPAGTALSVWARRSARSQIPQPTGPPIGRYL